MSELTPITRIEEYLDCIVDSGTPPLDPVTRVEIFLDAIANNQVCTLTPITRIEMFLGKISGQDIVLPEPITRIELYLAAIAGEDVELPEMPITRLEMYLAEWADSGDWTTISGAIVEFITQRAHKLKSCVVNLSPKQDLHGYDSPWPEGGGKNLFNIEDATLNSGAYGFSISRNGDVVTVSGTASASGNLSFALTTNYANGDLSGKGYVCQVFDLTQGYSLGGAWGFRTEDERAFAIALLDITEGQNVNVSMKLSVAATSQTAYSPYSNICPISGRTGVSVYDTGHNAWDEVWENGYIDANGNNAPSSAIIRSKNYIPVASGQSYCFHITDTASMWMSITQYDADKNFISQVSVLTNYVMTLNANTKFVRFYASSGYGNTYNHDISINYPSTDTEYHAYHGNSYSVTWEDEVFGGSVTIDNLGNVGTDELQAKIVLNGQQLGWNFGLGCAEVYNVPFAAVTDSNISKFMSSEFKAHRNSGVASMNNEFTVNGAKTMYIKAPSLFTDATTATAYFANNPVEFVGVLIDSVHHDLSPITPITALKGYNAMWSDGGDIEVTVHGTPVEVETLQALNMLLGGAYRNGGTADDVSDEEALDIILGGDNK